MGIIRKYFDQIIDSIKDSNQRHADFSQVPPKNLTHYHSDKSYYSFNDDTVIPYEEREKTETRTKEGLLPPEIIMIYYCGKTKKYPARDNQIYPAYWWFDYGIVDIDAFLKRLEEKGYIVLKDGQYKPTKTGTKAVKENEAVVWAHQTKCFGGAWDILRLLNKVPDRIKSYSWKDKVWYLFNKRASFYLEQANKNKDALRLYRNTLLEQAQFLEYEEKYKNAIKIYEKILEVDDLQNTIEQKQCEELGLDYEPLPPAPGIIFTINELKKKL